MNFCFSLDVTLDYRLKDGSTGRIYAKKSSFLENILRESHSNHSKEVISTVCQYLRIREDEIKFIIVSPFQKFSVYQDSIHIKENDSRKEDLNSVFYRVYESGDSLLCE